jgi:hypothetical protein
MSIVVHGFPFCEHRDCLAAASSYSSRCCAACAEHDSGGESCAACDTADELDEWGSRSRELLAELLGFLVGDEPLRPPADSPPAARRRGPCRRTAGDHASRRRTPPN